MSDLFRDATIGQIIRWASRGKLFKYPEEQADFQIPEAYKEPDHHELQMAALRAINERERAKGPSAPATDPEKHEAAEDSEAEKTKLAKVDEEQEAAEDTEGHQTAGDPEKQGAAGVPEERNHAEDAQKLGAAGTPNVSEKRLEKIETTKDIDGDHFEEIHGPHSNSTHPVSRVGTRTALSQSFTRMDLEEAFRQSTLELGPSAVVVPTKLADGTILVDWYTTDDPANPQNWSLRKKLFVTAQICVYTTAVYLGSSIYAASIGGVMEEFNVNVQLASMGLSMYVLAYGIGPMLWSPLSEMPLIGRNPPYMITFALFVILIIPSAVVNNFAGLVVLRFLQGFFGSPCLATGGASLQDMFSLIKVPYVLTLWAFSATCGPALAPLISGYSVPVKGWRWSMWELLWLAGPTLIVLFFCLPETSPSNILLRRAKRLRKLTGDDRLKSQSEIDQANTSIVGLIQENLWRPNQMMLLDPSVAFTAVYTALIYGIYYSFFECFPLVYEGMYHFNLGETGLAFLAIAIGVAVAMVLYWSYIYWVVEPDLRKNGLGAPEKRLVPALFASILLPIGLFIFAWTARPDVHWIGTCIGIAIFTIGIFIVIQCIFVYLPLTYPQYAASLFAGNDFARSTLATGAIHFSRPLFANLGVDRGVTLLAGLTVGCIFGVFALWHYGPKLRARSRFAAK